MRITGVRRPRARRAGAYRVVAIAIGIAALALAATALADVGELEPQDCIGDDDSIPEACVRHTDGLNGTSGVAVSPDGKSLYAASASDDAIVRFDRDPATGALTPAGCIDDIDTGADDCAQSAHGLGGARSVAVSADGKSVYVASAGDHAIARLARDTTTGAIAPRDCVEDDEDLTPTCTRVAPSLDGAFSVAVSADGKSVYAASIGDDAIVRFNRNTTTGEIEPKGCVHDDDTGFDTCSQEADGLDGVVSLAATPDGESLYAATFGDDAIVRLDRDPANGALTPAGCIDDNDSGPDGCGQSVDGLTGAASVAVSADGGSLYASSIDDDAIVRFKRNTADGSLTTAGCVDDNDSGIDDCAQSTDGLGSPTSIAPSANGRSLYAASLDDDAIARFDRSENGQITPIGCIDDNDSGPDLCAQSADGLDAAFGVAVSADGASLYSGSQADSAVARFDRSPGGALTANGCVDDNDTGPDACAVSADGLEHASGVAVSPDGTSVYVAAEEDDAIVRFKRDPASGALTPAGCIIDNDTAADECAQSADGLDGAFAVAISADGRSVYVAAADDDAIVRFNRNTTTGALTPVGCVQDNDSGIDACAQSTDGLDRAFSVAVSADGESVYATSFFDDAIVRFDRGSAGALTPAGCIDDNVSGPDACAQSAGGLNGAGSVAVSPDGNSVYVASFLYHAIARFDRSISTGALTPVGCIEDNDTGFGRCAQSANGLDGAASIALSPNGKSLYVAASGDDAITRFDRGLAGALVQVSCVEDNDTGVETCGQTADGLNGPISVAVSPDSKSVYAASTFDDAIVGFSRVASGQLTPEGCIDESAATQDTCAQVVEEGMRGPNAIALSSDGKSLYVADRGGAVGGKVIRFSRTPAGG